jgi:predicted transcriptional regulator
MSEAKSPRFRLRAGKKGLELRLHDLEAAIMDVVWSRRLSSFAVSEVLSVLEKRRDIAYTTVMTTVARLHDKGLLERERDGAVGGHQVLAMLAEKVSEASALELDELEALIRQRREELGE